MAETLDLVNPATWKFGRALACGNTAVTTPSELTPVTTISVNSNSSVRFSVPFGGYKQSGLGRELSMEALEHYSELKTVFWAS